MTSGVDEVSCTRQRNYLTLVADHRRAKIVWGCEGAGEKAADSFFSELDPEITEPLPPPEPPEIQPQSARPTDGEPASEDPEHRVGERARGAGGDLAGDGTWYAASARRHAPQAVICSDLYHVVQLANQKLDEVRRAYWNELRQSGVKDAARRFKDARWSLLKKPENLTDKQAATLARLRAAGGEVWRGYTLKAATRKIFEPGLILQDVTMLIDRLLSRLARSRPKPFVSFAKTVRKHRDGILAAVRLAINQGRTEALNTKVRLIVRRAYGFHFAKAALALVMLTCRPITLKLPHEPPLTMTLTHRC